MTPSVQAGSGKEETMMQRVLWWSTGLATLLAVAVWFDRSTDPINPATFKRIKRGMTLQEVEALVRRPSSFEPPWPLAQMLEEDVGEEDWKGGHLWVGKSYEIEVSIDEGGIVVSRYLLKVPQAEADPSIPDRIRAWLAGW